MFNNGRVCFIFRTNLLLQITCKEKVRGLVDFNYSWDDTEHKNPGNRF